MSEDSTWLLRYRIPILLLIGAATVGLASQLPSLRFDFSPQHMFETGEKGPAWEFFEESIELFGRDDTALFVVVDAGEGGDVLGEPVRQWLVALCERFDTDEDVKSTSSIATAITVRGDNADNLDVARVGDERAGFRQARADVGHRAHEFEHAGN